MPIETVKMSPISEEQFHEIDFTVMKQVFAIHNSLGRFYDEDVYRDDLVRLCRTAGFVAETEVPVKVVHRIFSKTYFMDLLINRSVVYELKTVKCFDGSHRRQLLNYLFLCMLFHGKLVDIHRDGEVIGRQKFKMLNEKTAFFFTAIKHRSDYRKYLQTLIQNTGIECVQWINLDKHNVEFVTAV